MFWHSRDVVVLHSHFLLVRLMLCDASWTMETKLLLLSRISRIHHHSSMRRPLRRSAVFCWTLWCSTTCSSSTCSSSSSSSCRRGTTVAHAAAFVHNPMPRRLDPTFLAGQTAIFNQRLCRQTNHSNRMFCINTAASSSSSENRRPLPQQQQQLLLLLQEHSSQTRAAAQQSQNSENAISSSTFPSSSSTTSPPISLFLSTTNQAKKNWTVADVLVASLAWLEQQQQQQHDDDNDNNVEEPVASVTHLLAHVLDLPWETGYRDLQQLLVDLLQQQQQQLQDNHQDETKNTVSAAAAAAAAAHQRLQQQILTPTQLDHFQDLLQRRCRHEPIQYLVGQWDFLDYTFQIQPPLLCPRPETEQLVHDLVWKQDLMIRMMMTTTATTATRSHNNKKNLLTTKAVKQESTTTTTRNEEEEDDDDDSSEVLRVLDVGCGTGCIGISLAAAMAATVKATTTTTTTTTPRRVHVTAIDIDPVAVETSRVNAQRILKRNHYDIEDAVVVYQVHLAAVEDFTPTAPFDVIVSNPPYIPDADWETLSPTVRDYESRQALTAGADGMNVIRSIVQQLATKEQHSWSKPGVTTCWMEVDPSQPALLREWLEKTPELGVDFVSTHKDFYGRPRFVKLRVRG